MPNETTVIIADDHPIFRKGLRDVIDSDPRFRVCGEAEDGETALSLIIREEPRVAVLDIEMPRISGIDVVRAVQSKHLPVSCIILTMYNDEELFDEAMEAGVRGYILKDSAILEIVRGIASVSEGEYFVSAAMTPAAFRNRNDTAPLLKERSGLHRLTEMEKVILRLIASEKSTKEISENLHISPRTVDNHRAHICSKLHLSGAYALITFAVKNKALLRP